MKTEHTLTSEKVDTAKATLENSKVAVQDDKTTLDKWVEVVDTARKNLNAKRAVVARARSMASDVILDAMDNAVSDRERAVSSYENAVSVLGKVSRPGSPAPGRQASLETPPDSENQKPPPYDP